MRKRDFWIGMGVITLVILLSLIQLLPQTITTGAWGLSYPTPGQTPSGPASTQQLQHYDAVYVGDTSQKVLYLTFDAGYENGYTPQILDTLKNHQVPAAFFWWAITWKKNRIWFGEWWRRGILWAITPCTIRT